MSNTKTYPGLFNGDLIDVLKVLKRCHHKQQDGSSDILEPSCYHKQQDLRRTAHGTCHRRPQSPQNLPPYMSNKKTYLGLFIVQVVGVLKVLKTCHHEQQEDLPRTAHGTCHRRPQSPQNLPP